MKKLFTAAAAIAAIALVVVLGGSALVANAGSDVPAAFAPLKLINGWSGGPFLTAAPAVEKVSGIVYFKGAMATTGINPVPFVLPSAFRPAHNVNVSVDLCNATYGRLEIARNGTTTVDAEGGNFSNAACFTSLDGVSFAP
jgi:hypothetical protein